MGENSLRDWPTVGRSTARLIHFAGGRGGANGTPAERQLLKDCYTARAPTHWGDPEAALTEPESKVGLEAAALE